MTLALKLFRSNGVPVTAAVKRTLVQANAARDAHDWTAAAAGYREALERDPELAHIWVQLGHALKEADDYDGAQAAYGRAARLSPRSADPHLHLGHLRKRQGDAAGASRAYLRAAKLEPNHPDAVGELHTIAAHGVDLTAGDLLSILQPVLDDAGLWAAPTLDDAADAAQTGVQELIDALGRDGRELHPEALERLHRASRLLDAVKQDIAAAPDADRAPDAPALVFDVSDLISYFRGARLPTGIQRVQIETITAALKAPAGGVVKVCSFVEHRDEWLEIPAAMFVALCTLSLKDGDRAAPEWLAALKRLFVLMNVAPAIDFPKGACLINLGTSWWLQNYFLFVRKAKAEHGVRYAPFVHDLIPIMTPEHCTTQLTQDFISWAIGAFEHADFFLANSEATKRDLLAVGAFLGHPVASEAVAVVTLDADIRKPQTEPAPKHALSGWGLARTPFVLFVSTIESRKNHLCAFEAWTQLLRTHGGRAVPKLVCVGNRGWLNDAVYAQLAANAALRSQVVMLSGVSDAELALLYRSCLFTLYPSRYEGWGLPVTESLCYGKVPLISDSSSLPEAGGAFAVYFESGSASRLAAALESLIFDAGHREARERAIAEGFRPRSWTAIAAQIASQAARRARSRPEATPPTPAARLGAYHPITRNFETRIWPGMRSGEVYRAGDGWWWPDDWGCWTKPQGGRLAIGLPERHGDLRLYLRLHGLPGQESGYSLTAGETRIEGRLKAEAFKWVQLDLPASEEPAPAVIVDLMGETAEDLGARTEGKDGRVVSIGVAGFFLCAADDAVGRTAFLEAVALDNVGDLAFNRAPRGYAAPAASLIAPPRVLEAAQP